MRGVAIDDEDNIYFIGEVDNKIGKSVRNGKNLHVREVHQVKGPGHIDIAVVVGDEVMVRQIKGRTNVGIRHLHPVCHGNLSVSDSNANITVISKTGIFLHSFGREQNGIQQLKSPWIIHVSGQYVYVADWSLKKTVVFTTEGNYVTAFGCYGGIFVNQDGVVYISDYINCKITCYY